MENPQEILVETKTLLEFKKGLEQNQFLRDPMINNEMIKSHYISLFNKIKQQ